MSYSYILDHVMKFTDEEISTWIEEKTKEGYFSLEKLQQTGKKGNNARRAAKHLAKEVIATERVREEYPNGYCKNCGSLESGEGSTGYFCTAHSDQDTVQPVHLEDFCYCYSLKNNS